MLSHAKNLIRTLTMNECLHILNVCRESKINDLDQSIFLLALGSGISEFFIWVMIDLVIIMKVLHSLF